MRKDPTSVQKSAGKEKTVEDKVEKVEVKKEEAVELNDDILSFGEQKTVEKDPLAVDV